MRSAHYAHSLAFHMMAREPADVSSTVLAAPVGGFEPATVPGGCVEPVVATEHHGSGAGLTALERAEAEFDRRERALTRLLAQADGANGSNHKIAYTRTYSDVVKSNINPIYSAGAASAAKDQATAGEQVQIQRRNIARYHRRHQRARRAKRADAPYIYQCIINLVCMKVSLT